MRISQHIAHSLDQRAPIGLQIRNRGPIMGAFAARPHRKVWFRRSFPVGTSVRRVLRSTTRLYNNSVVFRRRRAGYSYRHRHRPFVCVALRDCPHQDGQRKTRYCAASLREVRSPPVLLLLHPQSTNCIFHRLIYHRLIQIYLRPADSLHPSPTRPSISVL